MSIALVTTAFVYRSSTPRLIKYSSGSIMIFDSYCMRSVVLDSLFSIYSLNCLIYEYTNLDS